MIRTSPLLPVYNRSGLAFEYGQGAYLFAIDGQKYLDFASGVGVAMFGHSNHKIIQSLRKQADKLWHVNNTHESSTLRKFARHLVDSTFADLVFFCNSGTEAIECAIKVARNYFVQTGRPNTNRIITFTGAYHGRSYGALSASDLSMHTESFKPYLDGFDQAEFNDIESVKKLITDKTAAILIEPIQGQGGVRSASIEFLKSLRKLCDEHKIFLMFDEIQCGLGRTGKLFAHEYADIQPDVMTLAKGLGNGFPLGACLMTSEIGNKMQPGSHGSTFGGNALGLAVAQNVYNMVSDKALLEEIAKKGKTLHDKLDELRIAFPNVISEIRGKGLMIGIKFAKADCKQVVDKLLDIGILTVGSGDNVVRLLPPYIIEDEHINEALEKLKTVCKIIATTQKN